MMGKTLPPVGRLLAGGLGVTLLAAVVLWAGPGEIWRTVLALRGVLPLLFVAVLCKHVLRATAWSLAMRADGVRIPFHRVLRARVGAQSFAYVSGMGLLVSETVRAWLLRGSTSIRRVLAASVVESGLYLFTSVSVTTLGFAAAAYSVGEGSHGMLLFGGWLLLFALLTYLLFTKRPLSPGLAKGLARGRRLRRHLEPRLAGVIAKETEIRSFRLRHPTTALAVLAADVLVQLVSYAELWILLRALGSPFTLWQLLAIEAGGRTAKTMTFYLPGRIGADEAGAAGSFAFLGMRPAAGVGLAVARRLASLLWVGIGFLWLLLSPLAQSGGVGEEQGLSPALRLDEARTHEPGTGSR